MAALKTKPTVASVDGFLKGVVDEARREDCLTLMRIMRQATGAEPMMWGSSIVGFGSYHYKYASGREGDWFLTGFAPRKRDLTIYIMSGFENYEVLLDKLGKHKRAKSCLYIKHLADLDLRVLRKLVSESVKQVKQMYS